MEIILTGEIDPLANLFSVFNFNTTHESKMWMHRDKPLTVDPESVKLPPILSRY